MPSRVGFADGPHDTVRSWHHRRHLRHRRCQLRCRSQYKHRRCRIKHQFQHLCLHPRRLRPRRCILPLVRDFSATFSSESHMLRILSLFCPLRRFRQNHVGEEFLSASAICASEFCGRRIPLVFRKLSTTFPSELPHPHDSDRSVVEKCEKD